MPPRAPRFEKWVYFYTIKRFAKGKIRRLIKVGITSRKANVGSLDALSIRLSKSPNDHPPGVKDTLELLGIVSGSKDDEADIKLVLDSYGLNAEIKNYNNGDKLTEYYIDTPDTRRIISELLSQSCARTYDTVNYNRLIRSLKNPLVYESEFEH